MSNGLYYYYYFFTFVLSSSKLCRVLIYSQTHIMCVVSRSILEFTPFGTERSTQCSFHLRQTKGKLN
jgi:hypothetical protein